ncbi:MAG: flagellar biosynthesis protein FliQ [Halocynthiibacter sp.]
MTGAEVLDIGRDGVWTMLIVSGPLMIMALAVGLGVALLQALTQVQELTLVFVPKIIAMFLALIVLLPFMGATMARYMTQITDSIAKI